MKVFLVNNGLVSFIGQRETDITDEDTTVQLQKAVHINDALIPGASRPTRLQVLSNVSTFDTIQPTVYVRNIAYTVEITEDMELYKIYKELLLQATGLITSAGSDEVPKLTAT